MKGRIVVSDCNINFSRFFFQESGQTCIFGVHGAEEFRRHNRFS